jgi:hypothetical protein
MLWYIFIVYIFLILIGYWNECIWQTLSYLSTVGGGGFQFTCKSLERLNRIIWGLTVHIQNVPDKIKCLYFKELLWFILPHGLYKHSFHICTSFIHLFIVCYWDLRRVAMHISGCCMGRLLSRHFHTKSVFCDASKMWAYCRRSSSCVRIISTQYQPVIHKFSNPSLQQSASYYTHTEWRVRGGGKAQGTAGFATFNDWQDWIQSSTLLLRLLHI